MRKYLFFCLLCITAISCEKKAEIPAPTKTTLSLPNNNEACTNGTVISTTLSSILFKWAAAENAESYELTIKNLENGTIIKQTTSALELPITLSRNAPYAWFITAKSTKSSTTTSSETWKFYNAGEALSSYAPFPAEIVSPKMAQRITPTSGKITLDWTGSDVDNDIVGYDIYLGTTTSLILLKSNQVDSMLPEVAVNAATTYYWKVITKDSKGNTSDSDIHIFYTD